MKQMIRIQFLSDGIHTVIMPIKISLKVIRKDYYGKYTPRFIFVEV